MLELRNKTPFQAIIVPAMDNEYNEFIVVIIKATYRMVSACESLIIADEQLPILLSDEYHDEPNNSSLKYASESAMVKLNTDIFLAGYAYNFHGTGFVDTQLKVGVLSKKIRVFGDRYWEKLYAGWQISMPERFDKLPIVFENAYGGIEQSKGPEPKKYDDRNPVGKGFFHKKDERNMEGFPLPNLEDPQQLILNWRDKVKPVTYAPIAPHWAPRKSFSGTYDENWEKTRKPHLPLDFDERYFNAAPMDLVTNSYLQGGEVVECHNLSKNKHVRFFLPTQKFQLRYSMKRSTRDAPPLNLDTLLIKPEENLLSLTWRTRIPCNREFLYCDWLSLKTVD